MVGTNQNVLRGLINEKFTAMDMADTYEKRIKPYVQGIPYADAIEYLYRHMPQYMEMKLRQANLANLDAFFTDLRRIWLESRGRIAEQQPSPSQTLPIIQLPKDDFKIWLARDLAYSGIVTDDATLENFIYEELQKRLGGKQLMLERVPLRPKVPMPQRRLLES
jgi:hypothetical protein